jgi:hypothetical protein
MKLELVKPLFPDPSSEHEMISDALETIIIKRVDIGYELTGSDGVSIAVYRNWDPIFSTEYIEMRKAEVDRGGKTEIDETDE